MHTGQNYDYELNEVFFEELDIRRPDHFLEAAGATAAETIGQVIIARRHGARGAQARRAAASRRHQQRLAAIAAKRRKVPIFHMEAGNRCFDFRVPEEINRRIVDHIADINLTYSADRPASTCCAKGLPPDQVICTAARCER